MATIVFSHGFGVRADSRGMFTEIATAFSQHRFIMFDYNQVLASGDTNVDSLQAQAKKLQQVVNEQSDEIIILAHSQGCIITGLVDLKKVSKVILLAPPTDMSMQKVIRKLMKKPGAVINLNGTSKLPRRDGTTTYISKEYMHSIENVSPLEIYEKIASTTNTVIVRCTNDEILGQTNVNTLLNVKHIDVESDHNFTGPARQELLRLLAVEIG